MSPRISPLRIRVRNARLPIRRPLTLTHQILPLRTTTRDTALSSWMAGWWVLVQSVAAAAVVGAG